VPVFRAPARPDLDEQGPDALVVRGVQPEHPLEDGGGFVVAVEPPEAEPPPVQTAQERAVVHAAPGEHAVEALAEGELADAHADLVVADGLRDAAAEGEVAEVCVGIEASQDRARRWASTT
jgi:hypothetical protein